MATDKNPNRLPVVMKFILGLELISIVAFVVRLRINPGIAPLWPSSVFFVSLATVGIILLTNISDLATRSISWSEHVSRIRLRPRSNISAKTKRRVAGAYLLGLGVAGLMLILTGLVPTG